MTRPVRLLVAEDEPMIGRILEHKLVREGYQVTWVRDAAGLRGEAELRTADLALVDITLEEDGIEVVERLRSEGCAVAAQWLVLVEARDVTGRARAALCSAQGQVTKPFKPTVVAARVL
ncbi:MAG: response regulator, partial [Candidatus Dormibacteraeota bacterium]|nr:response regulator [Candidatus Dormibacteraeota bacterium]